MMIYENEMFNFSERFPTIIFPNNLPVRSSLIFDHLFDHPKWVN